MLNIQGVDDCLDGQTTWRLNPLSPNINMQILLTVLQIFLLVLVRRICLVIIFLILVTYMFDQVKMLC